MSANKEREVPVRIIYRKKGHGHGHHGGAWKVAFADFMTAMFAMFLVLWLINQSSDVKSAVAGYFQDPLGRADEFGSSIVPGEGAQASVVRPMRPTDVTDMRLNKMEVMSRLQEELASAPELKGVMDKIEIKLTDEGLQIQLLEDSTGVFFESGSASPSWRGRGVLAILGQELGQLPNPILIAGYTDARPYRRADGYSNWELSADRANTARRILQLNGVGDHQVLQIRGFADRDLLTPGDPYAASNRRVSITMKFDGTPAPSDSTGSAGPQAQGAFE
ncbi:MAG: OmpA family protein [Candidatus Eisenbacteria bacterium]|uniref:OmpA family protein n=1 Tax=Eiseniibacteriota bacterium TaxID=2212470 RepID=A0A933SFN2_UNCEI|nr:OmpA family protein [Candidatus Eisenbacteria bacterium]